MGDRVGREVTTRTLYILGTFTIRISPGGCCHVPLGHVPGVRPKGLRAFSFSRPSPLLARSNLSTFSASFPSLLFLSLLSTPCAALSLSLPRRALSTREIPQEKNGRDGNARRTVLGHSRVKGEKKFEFTSHLLAYPCFPYPTAGSSRAN